MQFKSVGCGLWWYEDANSGKISLINKLLNYCSIFLELPTVRESLRARDVPYLDINSQYLCNVALKQNYQIAGSGELNVREIV